MSDFTTADLAAVNAAIASGELTVRYGETAVTYRSVDELLRLRATIKQDLGAASTAKTYTLASFSKG